MIPSFAIGENMEEIQASKHEIRKDIATAIKEVPSKTLAGINEQIETRLFEFANFLESKIALLYINNSSEVFTEQIIKRCFDYNKLVVLPVFDTSKHTMQLFKIDNYNTDLKQGMRGLLEPNEARCKAVPIDCIDIAIIPGIAFDEKGGRIGTGDGYYDRLIPKLPITTRKVSLAFESQIIAQVPMESHDKHVDIIITENRVIYKI
jgi:5-formyltetrahydrofolate cyclo-ligase